MVTGAGIDVTAILRQVEDPELPVSIVDLGMVHRVDRLDDGRVVVVLIPTFLGCPAQLFIEEAVTAALADGGVACCEVRWSAEPWSLDRVSQEGRRQLRQIGIALPAGGGALSCPHCGSLRLEEQSEWGSTLCRKTAYCSRCRTPVEVLKAPAPDAVVLRPTRSGR